MPCGLSLRTSIVSEQPSQPSQEAFAARLLPSQSASWLRWRAATSAVDEFDRTGALLRQVRPTPATPPGLGAGPAPAGWADRDTRRGQRRPAGRWSGSPAWPGPAARASAARGRRAGPPAGPHADAGGTRRPAASGPPFPRNPLQPKKLLELAGKERRPAGPEPVGGGHRDRAGVELVQPAPDLGELLGHTGGEPGRISREPGR